MYKLSIAIITQNEEQNIRRCLESLRWADEIVVADSGSVDKTIAICQEFNCRIINTPWLGFGATKQLAVDNCSNDWVLVIDADEVITGRLEKKIKQILLNPDHDGYRIKRISFYLGKMINHCGWNEDYTLRLFDRNKGRFNAKIVHESVQILSGDIGLINEALLHYTYPNINSHIKKTINYAELGAEQKATQESRSSIVNACLRGIFKFLKMYLLQLGFLDGKEGFILSLNSAFGVYLKYIYVWEKGRISQK